MMIRRLRVIPLVVLALLALACSQDPVEPAPVNSEPEETKEEPQEEPVPAGKPRYVWIDASANFYYFANDKAYIATEVKKIADCGFTDIIVDVRPTEGTVLWKSKVAPEARRLAAWINSSYRFVEREASFDYLQAFIDAGHNSGLRVHAAINTFVGGYGGYYGLESEGAMFSGSIPTDWAAVDYTSDGLKSQYYEGKQGTVFLNPAKQEVQEYVLSLLRELAAYKLDGIVLDRCRYDDTGLQADFSPESKAGFTEYLGHEPTRWPVFDAGISSLPVAYNLSDEHKAWLAFRAKTIHDFVEKAADAVHSINKDVKFGVYVGAWYSSYYSSGVNWASPKYDTSKKYYWANAKYHNYGFADHCDYMFLGCYAASKSIYGSGEWTMEGFAKQGQTLLQGDTVFAGGPDIGNPDGWENGGKSAYIPKTVDAIINNSDGYFVFDLCHIRMFDYWNAFKKAFTEYIESLSITN